MVDAPGRFSMTNGWPSRSDSHCPISRAAMSVVPAGEAGTIRCTGPVDRLAPKRPVVRLGARQRSLPDAEIVGGRVDEEVAHPHPSQTRMCGFPASGSSWESLAQGSVCVEHILERHHGIVGEADKGTSALETWSHLELEPFIQHVMQENVREAR